MTSQQAAAIKALRQLRGVMDARQLRTIRGQVLAGDVRGAQKGVQRVLPAFEFKAYNSK